MWNDRFKAVTFFALVALNAVPANAQISEDETPRVRVTYSDLNLATPEGSEALQRRVHRAVASVCARPIANWEDRLSERHCETKALDEAAPQVELAIRDSHQAYAMKGSIRAIVIR